jgi:hypothetical protein
VTNRLAGVATLILRVARHEGWEKEAQEMLELWDTDQLESVLDNDEFSERVVAWMAKADWVPGIEYTAKGLDRALRMPPGFKDTDNPKLEDTEGWDGYRSLAVHIQKSRKAYEHRFGLVIKPSKTHGSKFIFNPPTCQGRSETRPLGRRKTRPDDCVVDGDWQGGWRLERRPAVRFADRV